MIGLRGNLHHEFGPDRKVVANKCVRKRNLEFASLLILLAYYLASLRNLLSFRADNHIPSL